MFTGVFALLERSLRSDARSRWTHGYRLATVSVGYIAMASAAETSALWGAPGLMFFQALMLMNAVLIVGAGISYFATTITEEKEEGTLGLMQMTGLSSLGILLGKSGSRLAQAAMLVLLQIPFALLGITLGGVTISQVQAMIAALLSLLFLVSNLALLISVLSRNSRQSAFWMTLTVAGYLGVAWICFVFIELFISRRSVVAGASGKAPNLAGIVQSLLGTLFPARMHNCLESGVAPPLISSHEIANVLGGVVAFGLAWALFGWATRDSNQEAVPRGRLELLVGRRRWFAPGRVWTPAMLWKEIHFLLGGWPRLVLKFVGYSAFMGLVWCYWHWLDNNWLTYNPDNDMAVEAGSVFLTMFLVWEGALLASRIFHEEIRAKTWSTLASTPIPLGELCVLKVLAGLIGLAPVALWLGSLGFLTDTGWSNLSNMLDDEEFWMLPAGALAIVHLAAFWSLYVRWGAVFLSLVCVWGSFILAALTLSPSGPARGFCVMMALFFLAVCVACYPLIARRLRELAAE